MCVMVEEIDVILSLSGVLHYYEKERKGDF